MCGCVDEWTCGLDVWTVDVDCGRGLWAWTVDGGRWSVVGGRWSVDWTVDVWME